MSSRQKRGREHGSNHSPSPHPAQPHPHTDQHDYERPTRCERDDATSDGCGLSFDDAMDDGGPLGGASPRPVPEHPSAASSTAAATTVTSTTTTTTTTTSSSSRSLMMQMQSHPAPARTPPPISATASQAALCAAPLALAAVTPAISLSRLIPAATTPALPSSLPTDATADESANATEDAAVAVVAVAVEAPRSTGGGGDTKAEGGDEGDAVAVLERGGNSTEHHSHSPNHHTHTHDHAHDHPRRLPDRSHKHHTGHHSRHAEPHGYQHTHRHVRGRLGRSPTRRRECSSSRRHHCHYHPHHNGDHDYNQSRKQSRHGGRKDHHHHDHDRNETAEEEENEAEGGYGGVMGDIMMEIRAAAPAASPEPVVVAGASADVSAEVVKVADNEGTIAVGDYPLPTSLCYMRSRGDIEKCVEKKHAKSLSFSDVKYTVKPFLKKPQQLLHDISAHVPAGSLIALMGPSGAGKTTLLDIIAGRDKGGKVEGQVWIDNVHPTLQYYKDHTAYVMQDSAFIGELSVRETILYRIKLKCPHLPSLEQEALAEKTICNFNLTKCKDTRVGCTGKRGISGGEKRRLSIAVEVISDPEILFIDEVTSGLDAQNALQVMQSVKNFCSTGCTVICTIHQPRPSIFSMFDKVLLLKDGYLVYYGPTSTVLDFFEKLGFFAFPEDPPADFIIDVLTEKPSSDLRAEITGKLAKMDYNGSKFNEAYRRSEWAKDSILPIDISDQFMQKEKGQTFQREFADWWIRLFTLSQRNWVENSRNFMIVWLRLLFCVVFGVAIGGVWFNLSKDPSQAYRRVAPLSFLMIAFSILVIPVMSQVLSSRQILFRERGFGLYSSLTFYIASAVQHVPVNLAMTLLLATPAYWMTFHGNAAQFFLFLFILFLNCDQSGCICKIIAMFSTNMVMSSALFVALFLICLLFSGALIYPVDVNEVVVRLSYFNYAVEALVNNEFRFDNSTTYHAILETKGFKEFLWQDIGILIGLEIVLHIALLITTAIVKERR